MNNADLMAQQVADAQEIQRLRQEVARYHNERDRLLDALGLEHTADITFAMQIIATLKDTLDLANRDGATVSLQEAEAPPPSKSVERRLMIQKGPKTEELVSKAEQLLAELEGAAHAQGVADQVCITAETCPACDRMAQDVINARTAILRFISANLE